MSTETEPAEFTYAWNSQGRDIFTWLLLSVAQDVPDVTREALAEATDKWQNIHLTMQINGVDVPTRTFLERLEFTMRSHAESEARRLVHEVGMDDLRDALDETEQVVREAQRAVADTLRERLKARGVNVPDRDEEY